MFDGFGMVGDWVKGGKVPLETNNKQNFEKHRSNSFNALSLGNKYRIQSQHVEIVMS